MPSFRYIAVIVGGTLLASALLIVISMFLSHVATAEYEAIKDWDEPLICWKVNIAGERTGEPVKLLWGNFVAPDEDGKLVFLKLDEGLYKFLQKGWICLPESHE